MIVYGHRRDPDGLVIMGKATQLGNHLRLDFARPALEWFAAGELRPFVFVAPRLEGFPVIPPDALRQPLETRIWANPKGRRLEHRQLAWAGWPLDATLLLLRPA